jgi:hypothetical protein
MRNDPITPVGRPPKSWVKLAGPVEHWVTQVAPLCRWRHPYWISSVLDGLAGLHRPFTCTLAAGGALQLVTMASDRFHGTTLALMLLMAVCHPPVRQHESRSESAAAVVIVRLNSKKPCPQIDDARQSQCFDSDTMELAAGTCDHVPPVVVTSLNSRW